MSEAFISLYTLFARFRLNVDKVIEFTADLGNTGIGTFQETLSMQQRNSVKNKVIDINKEKDEDDPEGRH